MDRRGGTRSLAAVASCLALTAVACSPADVGAVSTVASTLITTSTTVAPTTTDAPSTTTTLPTTTSTSMPDTTTTTTTAADTTSTSEVVDLTVELTDEGIQAGATWVPFGSDDDDTTAALTAILGTPSDDTGWLNSLTDGWQQFGACPSPRVRGVSWGEGSDISLQVLFTDGDTDFWIGGVEHFFTFYYSDTSEPTRLITPEGIGVGSSLGQLKAAYDPAEIEIDEAFFDPAIGFWSYDIQSWTGLWGFATGQTDAHVITSLNGGRGCGE